MGKGYPRQTARADARPARLTANEPACRAVLRGHPWVYRDAVAGALSGFRAGDIVELSAHGGGFLASVMVDPDSPIALRVLTRDADERVDGALVARRLGEALALRVALVVAEDTTALRLCNGEGDGLPGVVIDRYGPFGVVRTDGPSPSAFARSMREVIARELRAAGVTGLAHRERGAEVDLGWAGEPVPPVVQVREHGMAMEVDLGRGQKTGAFLDQRDNRRRVRGLSGDRRVLNLFSYAGGFSLAAGLGGAREITSVDIAAGAHATAQRSFRANGLDPAAHRFVTADVFTFLESAARRGERWDLVISDPPSFAPNERAVPRAHGAYRKLHAAAAAVLEPGGILCASSCSSHVPLEPFLATLEPLGSSLRLGETFGQPADHPTTAAWAEGRYLKFAILLAPSLARPSPPR